MGAGRAITGRWETDHVYDGKHSLAWASAEGIAHYNTSSKTLRSLLLVFSGAYRMAPPWDTLLTATTRALPQGLLPAVLGWPLGPAVGERSATSTGPAHWRSVS